MGISDEVARIFDETCEHRSELYEVDEGSNGRSYREETEANAIRPLYQLIALSRDALGGAYGARNHRRLGANGNTFVENTEIR